MIFIYCEKCGKKLISRLPNGLWQFQFGKRENSTPAIDMEIQGSIKMVCIRRSCRHVNILNYFPNNPEKE
jgi:hypothetical protein